MIKNITANYERLCGKEYDISHIYQPADYGWQGDFEGRALLAFCCHFEMSGKKIPCMDLIIKSFKEHTNKYLYFGKVFDKNNIDEQQISGNQWWVRGLLHYYKLFNDLTALSAVKSIMENFYLKLTDEFSDYPIRENSARGDVSGNISDTVGRWRLSTDVGCAFISMDCVSDYYESTKDERVKKLFDNQLAKFSEIDYLKVKMQTHAFLTATRSVLRMFSATGDKSYLDRARSLFSFHLENGMTLTYENINWFSRPDTWTEPCAVVDSFIIATRLYKETGDTTYLTLARRIWFNGLQFCQRDNGGAGPDTCVITKDTPLKVALYEAFFCCTMRYAEGLLNYYRNQALFIWNGREKEIIDEKGRRFIDDRLLVDFNGAKTPIFSLIGTPEKDALNLLLKIIF